MPLGLDSPVRFPASVRNGAALPLAFRAYTVTALLLELVT